MKYFHNTNVLLLFFFWTFLFTVMTRVGGKGDSKNNTESIETDNETDKHNDDEVGSSNLKEILRDNIRNSLDGNLNTSDFDLVKLGDKYHRRSDYKHGHYNTLYLVKDGRRHKISLRMILKLDEKYHQHLAEKIKELSKEDIEAMPLDGELNDINLDCDLSSEYYDNKTTSGDYWHYIKSNLKNKRIVVVGDSLTRYQYLNLIHAWHHNSWTESHYPHLEREKEWAGWENFFFGTSMRIGCAMLCDCYRKSELKYGQFFENRHYYDFEYNINWDYVLWLPPFNVSINKFPNFAFMEKRCSDIDALMDSTSNGHDGKIEYEYDYQSKDIVEVLGQALDGLDPDIIIINNGIWGYGTLNRENPSSVKKFVTGLKKITKRPIWKVTTSSRLKKVTDTDQFLSLLKQFGMEIFDTQKALPQDISIEKCYWDKVHFEPPIYKLLNQKMLDQLVPGFEV